MSKPFEFITSKYRNRHCINSCFNPTKKVVLISGGFDPLHEGHLDYIAGAKQKIYNRNDTHLLVALNSDMWLRQKKGYVFMTSTERKKILEAIRWVDEVIIMPADKTVADVILATRPDVFANSGDRSWCNADEAEIEACHSAGTITVYLPYMKKQSSSDLVTRIRGLNNVGMD